MKTCSKCTTDKAVSEFHRNKTAKDGLHNWCKVCCKQYRKKYYRQNMQTFKAKAKKYKKDNPDKVKVWKHKEYTDNKSRWADYNANRRAAIADQFVEDVRRDVVYDRDRGVCHICNKPVSREKFHVDHVIPISKSGEHSYANCKTAHAKCNLVKADKELV